MIKAIPNNTEFSILKGIKSGKKVNALSNAD